MKYRGIAILIIIAISLTGQYCILLDNATMDLQNAYKFGVKDDFLRDYISWKVFQGSFERTRRSSGIGKMLNNSILSY